MIEPEMTKMMIEHFFKDSILNMKKNGKDLMIHSFGTFEKNKTRIAGAKKTVKYQKISDLEKEYFEKNGSIPTRKASVDAIKTDTDNPYFNEAWSVLKYQVANTNFLGLE